MTQQDKEKLTREMSIYICLYLGQQIQASNINTLFGFKDKENRSILRYNKDLNACFTDDVHVHINRKGLIEYVYKDTAEHWPYESHLNVSPNPSTQTTRYLFDLLQFHDCFSEYFNAYLSDIAGDDFGDYEECFDENDHAIILDINMVRKLNRIYSENADDYLKIIYDALNFVVKNNLVY